MMKAQRWATSRWSGYLVFLVVLLATTLSALKASNPVAERLLTRSIGNQGAEVIAQVDQVMASVVRTLTAIDRSGHAACSAADLSLLRSELMRSKFTKDLGRLEGNDLACTTMLGVLPEPFVPKQRSIPLDGGLQLFWKAGLLLDPSTLGVVVRAKRSSLLIDLDAFGVPTSPGLNYVISLRDEPTPLVIGLDRHGLPGYIETARVAGFEQGKRFCSARVPLCATVVQARPAEDHANRQAAWLLGSAGILLGSALGGLALLLHRRRTALSAQIRRALANGGFTVRYQPIMRLGEPPEIVSAEALIRWPDGPAPPDVFIAEAERCGVIGAITAFVLDTVLEDMRGLFEKLPDFRVAINISTPELLDGSLAATLQRLWPEGLGRHHVGFELTERSTAELQDILPQLERLRGQGHPIYIDDFGTGYSSLAQLQHLPVDYIKVDRSLLPGSARQRASLIPEILAIARRLEVGLVFEGLETREQAQLLEGVGQTIFAQGWYFGHPETPDKLQERLKPGTRRCE